MQLKFILFPFLLNISVYYLSKQVNVEQNVWLAINHHVYADNIVIFCPLLVWSAAVFE